LVNQATAAAQHANLVYLELVKKAQRDGIDCILVSAPTPADLDRAFAEIEAKECEALFCALSSHILATNFFARGKGEIARCLLDT